MTPGTLFMSTFTQDKELSDLSGQAKKSSSAMEKDSFNTYSSTSQTGLESTVQEGFAVVILLLGSTAQSG